MKERIFSIILLLSAVLGCKPDKALPAGELKQGPLVKLGFISDLTGIGAYWGVQSMRGLELARKEIEKQGGQLEIVIGDHALSTTTAITEAQKMINLDKVDVLWVEFAPTAIAVSNLAARAGILYLNNSSATNILDSNPYAFRAYLDFQIGCQSIARFWRSKGVERIGMLKPNAEFSELCLLGVQAEYPDLLVVPYQFGEGVDSQLLKMRSQKVEAIVNPTFEADTLNMLSAMRKINYHPPLGSSEADLVTTTVLQQYQDLLENAVTFGFPAVSQGFKERYEATFEGDSMATIEAAAVSYTHVHQIFNAFRACPDKNIDCLVEQMAKSPPDQTLQFIKWQDRKVLYQFSLKEWHNQGEDLVAVDLTPN